MADTTVETRKVPLWVKLLLGLSLALNLAVLGLVGGVAMRLGGMPGGPAAINYAIPYMRALPKENRGEIGKRMRADARDGKLPKRQESRRAYGEMIALLSAETWDADAARAVLDGQSEHTRLIQIAAQAHWFDQIAGMSVAERQAYAQRLREVLEKRGKKHRN
jgi:uncharacterized membrane protein